MTILLTIKKALQPRDFIDRLYVTKKKRMGTPRIEDCFHGASKAFEEYIKKNEQRLITADSYKNHKQKIKIVKYLKKW